VISTILISFSILVVTNVLFGPIAVLMAGIALSSWFFASQLLWSKIDKKPINEILDNDAYWGRLIK
jgi:hypothetical protein